MKNLKIDNNARKFAKNASESIFSLQDEEKGILYSLAKNGPQTLTEIESNVSTYGKYEIKTRWAIKRRLYGMGSFLDLIKSGYIIEKENFKKTRRKKGTVYCLTIKGLLASLSELSIEKNYLYKNYVVFLKAILNRKIKKIGKHNNINTDLDKTTKSWLIGLFKNYIKYHIYTYLVWNDANELSLKYRSDVIWYLYKLLTQDIRKISQQLPRGENEERTEIYVEILRQSLFYEKILQWLNQLTSTESLSDTNEKLISLRDNLVMVSEYVLYWYNYFDRLQIYTKRKKSYPVNPIPSIIPEAPKIGINLEYYGKPRHMRSRKPNLKQVANNMISDGLKLEASVQNVWEIPFEPNKMFQWGKIPF